MGVSSCKFHQHNTVLKPTRGWSPWALDPRQKQSIQTQHTGKAGERPGSLAHPCHVQQRWESMCLVPSDITIHSGAIEMDTHIHTVTWTLVFTVVLSIITLNRNQHNMVIAKQMWDMPKSQNTTHYWTGSRYQDIQQLECISEVYAEQEKENKVDDSFHATFLKWKKGNRWQTNGWEGRS